ncbi:MAG: hypothetical protein ABH845_06705 [Candidatus Omnitrophota bacterium]
MGFFEIGDIVQHSKLETDKVIVGAGRDRYLCVHPEDIGSDGKVRPHARVALHRAVHLQKVGHHDGVIEISLQNLYRDEAVSKHGLPRRGKVRKFFLGALLALAACLLVLLLFTAIEMAREGIEQFTFRKIDKFKVKLYKEVQKKAKKMSPQEIDALKEKYRAMAPK